MTLLELLRQELPKRGGWPEGAAKATSYSHTSGVHFWDGDAFSVDFSDLTTRVLGEGLVTREQYEAASWDGIGLPPVGYECEMQNNNGQWINVCIIAQFDGFSFGWNYDYSMIYFSDKPTEFRPLRTEAERAIDEMVRLSGVSIGAAKILYDVGYRKG